jgi:hypothetical protein
MSAEEDRKGIEVGYKRNEFKSVRGRPHKVSDSLEFRGSCPRDSRVSGKIESEQAKR